MPKSASVNHGGRHFQMSQAGEIPNDGAEIGCFSDLPDIEAASPRNVKILSGRAMV